jgi:tellurite methyltransferase
MTDSTAFEAARKWNQRYLTDKRFSDAPVRKLILENIPLLPKSGWALEIAGGMGVTTDLLQRIGLQVLEIDISHHALRTAHDHNAAANHVVADASFFPMRNFQFDVICNFYFLERKIFSSIDDHLKPGGLLFFETMTIDMSTILPDTPPNQLLQHGELQQAFSKFQILKYFEGWVTSDHGNQKAIAQLIARKPARSV